MKFVIFSCLLAVALARPDYAAPQPGYAAPGSRRDDSREYIAIVRDDRQQGDDGSFSSDVETANGISESRSGSRLPNVEYNPVGQQGQVAFTFPNGEKYSLKFVANENGYQPESSHLPVAPAFPHPIPQFVLDQIAFAAKEDAAAASKGQRSYSDDSDEVVAAPSRRYSF